MNIPSDYEDQPFRDQPEIDQVQELSRAQEPPPQSPVRGPLRGARWFFAEFAVVVAGILVALALQSWWGSRQDSRRERAYIRQLVADLTETEKRFTEAEMRVSPHDLARAKLLHAFWNPTTTHHDSVIVCADMSGYYEDPRAILGTAEALVATGDLNLIKDDSVRAAITTFMESEERYAQLSRDNVEILIENSRHIWSMLDVLESAFIVFSPQTIDSIARSDSLWYIPLGARTSPFINDVREFLVSREAYAAVMSMADASRDMAGEREWRLMEIRHLKESLEEELR